MNVMICWNHLKPFPVYVPCSSGCSISALSLVIRILPATLSCQAVSNGKELKIAPIPACLRPSMLHDLKKHIRKKID